MGKKDELWTKWFHQSQRFASSHTNAIEAKRLSSTDETWCHLLSENALPIIEESSWWAMQGHQTFKVKLQSGLKPPQMSLKGLTAQLEIDHMLSNCLAANSLQELCEFCDLKTCTEVRKLKYHTQKQSKVVVVQSLFYFRIKVWFFHISKPIFLQSITWISSSINRHNT